MINLTETQLESQRKEMHSYLSSFKLSNSRQSFSEVEWTDFSYFKDFCKEKLRLVYLEEFREHPSFLELIVKLYQMEIEYKLLQEAEVIKTH